MEEGFFSMCSFFSNNGDGFLCTAKVNVRLLLIVGSRALRSRNIFTIRSYLHDLNKISGQTNPTCITKMKKLRARLYNRH